MSQKCPCELQIPFICHGITEHTLLCTQLINLFASCSESTQDTLSKFLFLAVQKQNLSTHIDKHMPIKYTCVYGI